MFLRFSFEDWGIDRRFYPAENLDQIKINIEVGPEAPLVCLNTSLKPLYYHSILFGQGTIVLQGDIITSDSGAVVAPVAIKISYPETGWVPEQEFIQQGHNIGGGQVVEYFSYIFVSEDPPFATGEFFELHQLAKSKGQPQKCCIIVFELESIATLSNLADFVAAW